MKKYSSPLFEMVDVQVKDVITVSAGSQGKLTRFNFSEIISDGSDWIEE